MVVAAWWRGAGVLSSFCFDTLLQFDKFFFMERYNAILKTINRCIPLVCYPFYYQRSCGAVVQFNLHQV